MKTELVDVNETRKNLHVEIPSERRRRRDRSHRARLLAQGAHSRLPAGQGAGARHQAAVQGSDPPRRRARSRPARDRRSAARARRRAGRHARRPRRDRRGGPAADLHGVVRHGAGVRAGRLRDAVAAAARRATSRTRRSTRRCSGCASAPRGSSRSKAAASIDGDTVVGRSRAQGRRRRQADDARGRRASSSGAKANPPGFDEQLLGLEAGAAKTFDGSLPGRLPDRGAGGHRRLLYRDGQGAQAARAAGARRRVREGPGRVRDARRAAGARARGSRARGAARGRARRARPS